MASTEQQERRQQENRCLSVLVDLGVTYRRTLGERVAWAFFTTNDIAHTVVHRVMGHDGPRRPTDWERQLARMAELRQRPLETDSAG